METLLSMMLFGSPTKDLTDTARKKAMIEAFCTFCTSMNFDVKTDAGRTAAIKAWKEIQGAV